LGFFVFSRTVTSMFAHRREGVVMKLCNAPYGLNDRTEAWVKLKPDYMEGVSETLDVVIVGGYLGQGTVWTGCGNVGV
jgi:DNA ligase 4